MNKSPEEQINFGFTESVSPRVWKQILLIFSQADGLLRHLAVEMLPEISCLKY